MSSSARATRRLLAVSLLSSVAVLAVGCSSGGTASPSDTVTVTAPPGATAPPSTPAPTGSATTPTGPAECTTAGLHVTVGTSQGAAGTIYYNIDFTNVSSSSCVLQGYPGVSLVTAGSTASSQIGADAKRSSASPANPTTLAPGQTAHAQLGITQAGAFPASTCQPVSAHWLKVFPPDQTVPAFLSLQTQTCASTSVSTMRIGTIGAGA
jgi:hypothetical protein